MTTNLKKAGRPPKQPHTPISYAAQEALNLLSTLKNEEETAMAKVGTFITVNTVNVKGLRINLDKVFSYAPNGETSIQIAQGDGNSTTLSFGSKEAMLETLELIDARCQ